MIDQLRTRLASGKAFVLHVFLRGGGRFDNLGLMAIDAIGITTDHPRHEAMCLPWTSIGYILIEETEA